MLTLTTKNIPFFIRGSSTYRSCCGILTCLLLSLTPKKFASCDQEAHVGPIFSVIISTKNRHELIQGLLHSIKQLNDLHRIRPEIIVGDNVSEDETWEVLQREAANFPVPLRILQVHTPGKSAVLNEAVRLAEGEVLVFVDDDVIPDMGWLEALERFFATGKYKAAQGRIGIQAPESGDPEIQKLIERYRTIPQFKCSPTAKQLHSLNGANIAVSREAVRSVGGFDERLGPGASGTSEDVDLARRLNQAGIAIGYIPDAVVYHRVDRARLTEDYFKSIHRLQGKSRLIIKDRAITHILLELSRVSAQCAFYSIVGRERRMYRSKGRIYHYLGMLESKWNGHVKK